MDWMTEDTGMEMEIIVEEGVEDYMTWLIEELRGMKV